MPTPSTVGKKDSTLSWVPGDRLLFKMSFLPHLPKRAPGQLSSLMSGQGHENKKLRWPPHQKLLDCIKYSYCFFFAHLFFWRGGVFFHFPKSAQVGSRLPDTRTSTATRLLLFHVHVSGGGRSGRGQEGREKMWKIHLPKSHKATYVPSIMEVCAPQHLDNTG